MSFLGGSNSKESAYNAREPSSIPGSGSSPGEGIGNTLQYSCLENFMDKRAWQATVHRVAKSWTPLTRLSTQAAHRYTSSKSIHKSMGVIYTKFSTELASVEKWRER